MFYAYGGGILKRQKESSCNSIGDGGCSQHGQHSTQGPGGFNGKWISPAPPALLHPTTTCACHSCIPFARLLLHFLLNCYYLYNDCHHSYQRHHHQATTPDGRSVLVLTFSSSFSSAFPLLPYILRRVSTTRSTSFATLWSQAYAAQSEIMQGLFWEMHGKQARSPVPHSPCSHFSPSPLATAEHV